MRNKDVVELRNCPGVFQIICIIPGNAVMLRGYDETGKAIAAMDPSGTIVVDRKEIVPTVNPNQETLL